MAYKQQINYIIMGLNSGSSSVICLSLQYLNHVYPIRRHVAALLIGQVARDLTCMPSGQLIRSRGPRAGLEHTTERLGQMRFESECSARVGGWVLIMAHL